MDGSVRLDGGAVVYINNEIKDIIREVDDQLLNAKHNKQNLFTGNSLTFYSGIKAQNSMTAPVYTYTALDSDTLDLTVNAASTSISYIDNRINEVRNVKSQYAAFYNRIENEIDYIADALLQNSQTLSNIVDTDMAIETFPTISSFPNHYFEDFPHIRPQLVEVWGQPPTKWGNGSS